MCVLALGLECGPPDREREASVPVVGSEARVIRVACEVQPLPHLWRRRQCQAASRVGSGHF